jgi:RNA polymerase sigma-70 factor (ECF subfamily)
MDLHQPNSTDEELVVLAQGNNEEAFGVIIERYQGRLLRYGRRFLSDNDHIEDVVQNVFIKTYQNIRSFDATRKFSPWIYRIAHNAFVNELRRQHREPLSFIDFDTLAAHPSYEQDPAGEEDKKTIKALVDSGLETLPAIYKEIIILYYVEDLSYQEISDILHVPLGTVSVRLRRGRDALKKAIQKKDISQ